MRLFATTVLTLIAFNSFANETVCGSLAKITENSKDENSLTLNYVTKSQCQEAEPVYSNLTEAQFSLVLSTITTSGDSSPEICVSTPSCEDKTVVDLYLKF